MSKAKEKNVRRINRLLILISSIVSIYTIVNLISIQYNINQKKQEIQILNEKINIQLYNIEEISGKIEEGATNSAIIQVAQDKLGLALPGERVIADIGSK